MVWRCKDTGVWKKARPDCIPNDGGDFNDLKTTVSVATDALQRTIADYLIAVHRAVDYLLKVIPKSSIKDMVGVRHLSPSDMRLSKFRRIYAVAEDPLTALRSLAAGTLVRDQAIALQVMFPQVFEATKTAIFDAFTEKRAADMAWTLPFAKDRLLQTLLLTTPENTAAVRVLQQNYAAAKERKGAEQADEPRTPAKGAAKALETSVQRASQ